MLKIKLKHRIEISRHLASLQLPLKRERNNANFIFALQFFVVYIFVLGFALLGVWILNIALYISVKRTPALTETSQTNSTGTPTSTDAIQRQASRIKPRTSWVSLTALIGKRLSTASGFESNTTTIQTEQCHTSQQHFYRKHLELALARTVRYIVVAFSLALLPSLIAIGIGRISTLRPSDSNFSPLNKAVWNGFSYLASRILFSNSFINCNIYSYRSKSFRIALKSLLSCSKKGY